MSHIGIGIIGTGFMGQAHALAYRAAGGVFPLARKPVLAVVADSNEVAGRAAQAQYDFGRFTPDWRALVNDPSVEIVSITTPNRLHKEMALAAIAAGKHVHCEKPLAPNAADAREMMEAAEKAGVVTQAGFNYIKNPVLKLAREMIAAGELGDILGFRGIHSEDYMSDPKGVWTWRLDPQGGGGVIADLGSHIIGMARYLLGPITDVFADLETVIPMRPIAQGSNETRAVDVDDIARLTVRFARGCGGSIEANWCATGRKMNLGFEISGTKGALIFNQEHFNEIHYYKTGGDHRHQGFTRIEAGPAHHPYIRFCIASGHQIGFNDLKTIEVGEFLSRIEGGPLEGPDFREAYEIQKIIDLALRSSRERTWLPVS